MNNWLWLYFNLELNEEIKEMERLGLTDIEIIGALDIMLDNNYEQLEVRGKS